MVTVLGCYLLRNLGHFFRNNVSTAPLSPLPRPTFLKEVEIIIFISAHSPLYKLCHPAATTYPALPIHVAAYSQCLSTGTQAGHAYPTRLLSCIATPPTLQHCNAYLRFHMLATPLHRLIKPTIPAHRLFNTTMPIHVAVYLQCHYTDSSDTHCLLSALLSPKPTKPLYVSL